LQQPAYQRFWRSHYNPYEGVGATGPGHPVDYQSGVGLTKNENMNQGSFITDEEKQSQLKRLADFQKQNEKEAPPGPGETSTGGSF